MVEICAVLGCCSCSYHFNSDTNTLQCTLLTGTPATSEWYVSCANMVLATARLNCTWGCVSSTVRTGWLEHCSTSLHVSRLQFLTDDCFHVGQIWPYSQCFIHSLLTVCKFIDSYTLCRRRCGWCLSRCLDLKSITSYKSFNNKLKIFLRSSSD